MKRMKGHRQFTSCSQSLPPITTDQPHSRHRQGVRGGAVAYCAYASESIPDVSLQAYVQSCFAPLSRKQTGSAESFHSFKC